MYQKLFFVICALICVSILFVCKFNDLEIVRKEPLPLLLTIQENPNFDMVTRGIRENEATMQIKNIIGKNKEIWNKLFITMETPNIKSTAEFEKNLNTEVKNSKNTVPLLNTTVASPKLATTGFKNYTETLTTPEPVTVFHIPVNILTKNEQKCPITTKLDIVFLVKTFINNFEKRMAIRQTWGQNDPFPDVHTRLVFLMGIIRKNDTIRVETEKEHQLYDDILLGDFEDEYFNVTRKVMMGIEWARTFCSNSKFYIFADDDAYISVRNMITYLRKEVTYDDWKMMPNEFLLKDNKGMEITSAEEASLKLRFFGGNVHNPEPPLRSGKWMISVSEFEYDMYPRFINGHTMVMSRQILDDFSLAARFTKYVSLDDVYLGIVAVRAGVIPLQMPNFSSFGLNVNRTEDYDRILSCHYTAPQDTLRIFAIQRDKGNA